MNNSSYESNISSLVEQIPCYEQFLTVDELDNSSKLLAEKYPEIVSLINIGSSKSGYPIYCLKIGKGDNNAIVFGCPHPNEPIGTLMIEYLADQLAKNEELRNEFNYTWYFIKVWDIDGTKLNEKWFKGPFTIRNYATNFFRPTENNQVDWTFPLNYKYLNYNTPMAETKAMMTLIDLIKPKFIYALHNASFGGAYWYMNKPLYNVFEKIKDSAIKRNIPIYLGNPEVPFAKLYDAPFYKSISTKDGYDYLESNGANMKEIAKTINRGDSSTGYSEKYGTFSLLTELPYFCIDEVSNDSLSDISKYEAINRQKEIRKRTKESLEEIFNSIKETISADNVFFNAIKPFIMSSTTSSILNVAAYNNDLNQKATKAEKFECIYGTTFYNALNLSLCIRGLKYELLRNDLHNDNVNLINNMLNKIDKQFNKEIDFLESNVNYKAANIRDLVAIQLESGLLALEQL